MRKILLAAVGLLLASQSNGQGKEKADPTLLIGPVGGAGHSWVDKLNGNNEFKLSGFLGINVIHIKNEHWRFGTSVVVSAEGYKIEADRSIKAVTPVYLRLPFRAYYVFGCSKVRPSVFAGPTFGLKMVELSEENRTYGNMFFRENSNQFKKIDFGFNAGAGVNIKTSSTTWLTLDCGYYHGLTDAMELAESTNKNQTLTFNVGLLYVLK